MTTTQPIVNTLRFYRKQAGLLQKDVARALHLDCMDRISRWENGSAMPSVVNLFRLSILYQVSPQKLYEELFQAVEGEIRHPASPENATTT